MRLLLLAAVRQVSSMLDNATHDEIYVSNGGAVAPRVGVPTTGHPRRVRSVHLGNIAAPCVNMNGKRKSLRCE